MMILPHTLNVNDRASAERILNDRSVARLVEIALAEDIGTGDVTAESTIAPTARSVASFLVKQDGIVCGLPVAKMIFQHLLRNQRSLSASEAASELIDGESLINDTFHWQEFVADGTRVSAGAVVAQVEGSARLLLMAERTALNFMQRMSGVATQTSIYAEVVAGTGTQVIDTRKTIPGWRLLDKYAVRMGGGANHRFGLYDMAMIKDNHRDAAGSITAALTLCNEERMRFPEHQRFPIEVETRSLEDVREVLDCAEAGLHVRRVMFDNFTPFDVRKGVVMVHDYMRSRDESNESDERSPAERIETEASGGITLYTIRKFAETGVDFISVGALTHSAPALDISMKFLPTLPEEVQQGRLF